MTLEDFFQANKKMALAFSGGVDSAYLLYAACRCGADVRPYYVKTCFQPAFEFQDAEKLARSLGVSMTVVEISILDKERIRKNPGDRCYYCKRAILGAILEQARRDGYDLLLDGTNASDDISDRPGYRALQELEVRSPLREAGLTKKRIRELSHEAGLFTWDKPAYACLATRIPTGETITADKLARTEAAEAYLFSLGLTDFRVRLYGGAARIQVPEGQLAQVLAHRAEIVERLRRDYPAVLLDLEVRG